MGGVLQERKGCPALPRPRKRQLLRASALRVNCFSGAEDAFLRPGRRGGAKFFSRRKTRHRDNVTDSVRTHSPAFSARPPNRNPDKWNFNLANSGEICVRTGAAAPGETAVADGVRPRSVSLSHADHPS